MAKGLRECADCGTATSRRTRDHGTPLCLDCGIARAARAAREMHARSGPAWDAYVASGNAQGRQNAPRDSRGRYAPD